MGRSKLVLSLLATFVLALAASQSHAQTLTTLATFDGTNGQDPGSNLTLSNDGSTLYGMTATGGTTHQGNIFSIPLFGGTPTTLLNFNGTNGTNPYGDVTLGANGSTLYGMTRFGGTTGGGAIVSIPVTGGTPTWVSSFNNTDGGAPIGSLTLVGSTLYGMTENGGVNGQGNIFSIPVNGGTPTNVFSFTNGDNPLGSLTLSANGSTFYGMTSSGGIYNGGDIFSFPVTGGTPTVLFSFHGVYGTDGDTPYGSLTLSADGSTLYGMTLLGGTHGDGNIFSIPVTGGALTWDSSFNGTDGASPYGSLTLVGSTLYGTTVAGGLHNDGTIFSIPVTGGTPTTLFAFNGGTDGAEPNGSLTLVGSSLYGMTASGGADDGHGTVFALTTPEPSSVVLFCFGAIGLGAMALRRKQPTS